MKDARTTALTRSLVDAARRDRPSAADRSRIWQGINLTPHLSVVAAVGSGSAHLREVVGGASSVKAAGVAVSGGLSVGKLLLVGAVAGSALTAAFGLALVRAPVRAPMHFLRVVDPGPGVAGFEPKGAGSVSPRPDSTSGGPRAGEGSTDGTVTAATVAGPGSSMGPAPSLPSYRSTAVDLARPARLRTTGGNREVLSENPLMHEAALVSEARTELAEGRAESALAALESVARGESHSLEPEELSLRARALRVLGREAEAGEVERALRTRYPDNFLSR